MEQLLAIEIWNGQTLGDVLTLDFVAGIAGNVASAVAILVLGYMIAGWVRRKIIRLGFAYKELDNTLFSFLGNILRYAILAFAVVFVLNTFGIQTTSIVAIMGAASLAIGLALQGTLSNVAAGVMIIVFRPIKLGQYVIVNGQGGTVKDISLNYTELATIDNLQVIVPNAQVWGNTITNYSVYDTRRAEWVFGVSYGTDLKKAEDIIRETITADPRALADPAPFLQVNALGDFSVDFLCRVWCNSGDYFTFQADMKRAVKEAFDAAGIDIPFPTSTVIRA